MKVRYMLYITLTGFLLFAQETNARDCAIVTVSGFSTQCQDCRWEGDYLKFVLNGEWKQVRKENLAELSWLGEPSEYDLKFDDDILNLPHEKLTSWILYKGGDPHNKDSLLKLSGDSMITVLNYKKECIDRYVLGLQPYPLSKNENEACGTLIVSSALLIAIDPTNAGTYYWAIGYGYEAFSEEILARRYYEIGCSKYNEEMACHALQDLDSQ